MSASETHQVTHILEALSSGEERAADELLDLVYSELHRLFCHRVWVERRPGRFGVAESQQEADPEGRPTPRKIRRIRIAAGGRPRGSSDAAEDSA